jgi:PAP2 superfamily
VWLSWDMAAFLGVFLAVAGVGITRYAGGRWVGAAAFATEASLVAGLYAVWQLVGDFTPTRVNGAAGHGLWLWHVEQALHLPSELRMERAILGHPLIVQAANVFYAVVHVPALGIFLFWLYFRHRDSYPFYRTVLAAITFICFLIHLIPVAPPRLLPGVGFVDTALLYHQSVYGPAGTGVSDQVSAMPSMHLAWACLIALAVIQVSPSRWRWLILLHPVLTMLVVVITANHFWLDGLVAVGLLGLIVVALRATESVIGTPEPPAPVEAEAVTVS